ncbi:gamma-glutamyltransferase [Candidatus Methylospira mobilis]|uniref:Glutathione hydrolase proenzyme n=1 Tax=Candidatus Methylospira mobilis TaxID=1808979 RepID=A0A5Q0BLX4_9GAMM|nr:gamma-glutamyltransferase [Candidatus Methylospira mobilis]QFY42756.1 gamma-glutamyltransferase [Candidatus Methylospira mobilis]WNV04119.1 gamma-glutamyltransferase [Candidatus Methylospira mobilis]
MSKLIISLALSALIFNVRAAEGPGHAAIASAHPLATRAGFEVLEQGGNAFDAAVAVSAALAVVEPQSSGIGGGGFWLLRRASDGKTVMLDGRETAPSEARPDMYLDEYGEPRAQASLVGAFAAGVPGLPAALVHLSKHYGRLPLQKTLAPAIALAESGFEAGERYIKAAAAHQAELKQSPAAAVIFLDQGKAPAPGFRLLQKDLAETLKRIAKQGGDGFYRGQTAAMLLQGVRDGGGIWQDKDLQNYRVQERTPVSGEYRGIRVISAAPPSSGGAVLLEALNILSGFRLLPDDPLGSKHVIIEAERRAYHDRDLYLGDPGFVHIPLTRLLSPDYAAGLRASIRLDRALPSEMLSTSAVQSHQGDNTTHFSIIDRYGDLVTATLSINSVFGSCFVAAGSGVLLNDEMDDFAVAPGRPNSYGLVGGNANAIAPGKRMLSSMTPTILETQDRIALLGTPGGSRIVSMVLLGVLDFAQGHGPESWVSIQRYHHQYLPDVVEYEPGALNDEEVQGLSRLGHRFKQTAKPYGDMQAVLWDKKKNQLSAASDPRGEGVAEVR